MRRHARRPARATAPGCRAPRSVISVRLLSGIDRVTTARARMRSLPRRDLLRRIEPYAGRCGRVRDERGMVRVARRAALVQDELHRRERHRRARRGRSLPRRRRACATKNATRSDAGHHRPGERRDPRAEREAHVEPVTDERAAEEEDPEQAASCTVLPYTMEKWLLSIVKRAGTSCSCCGSSAAWRARVTCGSCGRPSLRRRHELPLRGDDVHRDVARHARAEHRADVDERGAAAQHVRQRPRRRPPRTASDSAMATLSKRAEQRARAVVDDPRSDDDADADVDRPSPARGARRSDRSSAPRRPSSRGGAAARTPSSTSCTPAT